MFGLVALNGVYDNRIFYAKRRNMREQASLDIQLKLYDRAKTILSTIVRRDKKQAVLDQMRMMRTTGVCDIGKAPSGGDDNAYASSKYSAHRVSDKRLRSWRQKEKLLQKFLKAKAVPKLDMDEDDRSPSSKFELRRLTCSTRDRDKLEKELKIEQLEAQRIACDLLHRGLWVRQSEHELETKGSASNPHATNSLVHIRPQSAPDKKNLPVKTDKRPRSAYARRSSVSHAHRDSLHSTGRRHSVSLAQKQEVKINNFFHYLEGGLTSDAADIEHGVSGDTKASRPVHVEVSNDEETHNLSTQVHKEHRQANESYPNVSHSVREWQSDNSLQVLDMSYDEITSFSNELLQSILHSKKAFTKAAIKNALESLIDEHCPDQALISRQKMLRVLECETKELYSAARRFSICLPQILHLTLSASNIV